MLASDLAVIDAWSQLGLPEVKRGLMAAAGGVIRTSGRCPSSTPSRWRSPVTRCGAERAVEWGLANRVGPGRGTALEVALDLAGRIAANAPLSVGRPRERCTHARGRLGLGRRDLGDQQPRHGPDHALRGLQRRHPGIRGKT